MKVASIAPPDAVEELVFENGIHIRLVSDATINFFAPGATSAHRVLAFGTLANASALFADLKKQLK